MKYQVTKKQCQKQIDEANNVCGYCGRALVPIKTVNNADEPTYWTGCMHGEGSGHYTCGVPKWVYDLAVKLVLEDTSGFRMTYDDKRVDLEYAFRNACYRASHLIQVIEYMKTKTPEYTKEQLFERNKSL